MSIEQADEAEPTESPIEGVVVGFDGSPTAILALDWAADTASAYGVPLTLLRARPNAEGEVLEVDIDSEDAADILGAAHAEALEDAAERVAASHPHLEVKVVVHPDAPVDALLDASRSAEVIAMGSRGLEGFAGLLVGSTVMNVTPHAHCPVVVLYQPDEKTELAKAHAKHPAEVVVGYDGSESSDAALAFALRHAAATGLGVSVLVVTKGRKGSADPVPVSAADEGLAEGVGELLAAAASVAEGADAPVSYLHAVGRPAGVLISEAAGAPMAVVGARGRGGFAGLVLGSVGLQMLIHAECPVAVVHTAEAD